MKRPLAHLCCLLFIYLLTVSPVLGQGSNVEHIKDGKLMLGDQQIPLESPLITLDSVAYFPVNDLASFLDTPFRYDRRQDSFTFRIKKNKLNVTIPRGANELWINDFQQFLHQPTLLYKNRLYVPMKDFFRLTGFTYLALGPRYMVNFSDLPQVTHHQIGVVDEEEDIEIIKTLSLDQGKVTHDFVLPNLEEIPTWHIQIGAKQYPMSDSSFYDRRHIYVNIDKLLEEEGFIVERDGDEVLFLKEFAKFKFTLNSREVIRAYGLEEERLNMARPLIQKGRKLYFPLASFLKVMAFTPHWDPQGKTLSLLKNIRHIRVVKDEVDFKLQIFSTQGIVTAKPVEKLAADSTSQGQLIINLPLTTVWESQSAEVSQSPISFFSIHKKDSTSSELRLNLRKAIVSAPITETAFGSELSFRSAISSIKQEKRGNRVVFSIQGNGPFTHKSWFEKGKLIIDIPDTINELPLFTRSDFVGIEKVRASQKSKDPLLTRVVFDLSKTGSITRDKINERTLEVSFPHYKPPTKPVVAKKRSTAPAKKPSKGLRRKIIFIDPGHGGRDPGAVVKRKIYEKNFTIDISRRLEKRLKEAGAYVVMARKNDENPSLRRRVVMANRNKADAFVSVHVNSFGQPVGRGTETYYYKYKEKRLATLIHNQLTKNLGLRNNGIKRTGFYVLRYAHMPSVLVEPLFMTNPKEFALLESPAFRQKIADSIFNGLKAYFK